MKLSLTRPSYAKILAEKHTPFIRQEFLFWHDIPHRICFGEYMPGRGPEVYYAVRSDSTNYYLFYGLYHYRDVNHRHDFQGAQLILPRKKDKDAYLITRAHHTLPIAREYIFDYRLWFAIQVSAGGHAVEQIPLSEGWYRCRARHVPQIIYGPGSYDLKNMMNYRERLGDQVRKMGDYVTHPEEWGCAVMDKRKSVLKRHGLKTTKGLFWRDPMKLITIANELEMF